MHPIASTIYRSWKKPLKAILDTGDQILQALAANDLDTFYNLIEKRDKLVAWLKRTSNKTNQSHIRVDDARALESQFKEIVEMMNKKEEQMMAQLRELDRFRKPATRMVRTVRQKNAGSLSIEIFWAKLLFNGC